MKKINPGEKVSGKHLDWNNLKTFPRQGKFYFNFCGITSVYLSCETNRLRFTACLFKITKDFKIGVTRTSKSLSHAIVWSNKAFFFFPYRLITRDLHSEKLGVRHQLARCFFRLVASVGQWKHTESPRGIAPQTFSDALPFSHRDSMVSKANYGVLIWHASCLPLGSAMSIPSCFVYRIRKMVDFNSYQSKSVMY